MNNFLNKLESKRSVHEKYTKVKKNEFNTIIETLDKSIKKLMPTEHGLHRPPEYQVPVLSQSYTCLTFTSCRALLLQILDIFPHSALIA